MSQSCVRINPQKWVDENSLSEEHAVLVTVERPRSHDLFCTKNIVFLGPLGLAEGGIPLRTLTIGPGNRDVATKNDDASGHGFHVNTTTFYAHYAHDEGLVAAQFEILWQFQRFARNEKVTGVSNEIRDRILTVGGESTLPRTAYDERNHQYVYQGWKRAHFQKFWEEYRIFKDTAHVFNRYMKFAHNEKVDWKKLNPPRTLTESEKKEFEQEYKLLDPSNPSKLDMTLEELVSKNQSPKESPLRRARNAGITKDSTSPPARATYSGSPRKGRLGNRPTSLMAEDPIIRPRDIFGSTRSNRFSRRPQDNRPGRRNSSQPSRFRNYQAPLTENNIRRFNALTGFDSHNASQPRSPPPEEPYTHGLVDTNKGDIVEKYLGSQECGEEYTPMELDG